MLPGLILFTNLSAIQEASRGHQSSAIASPMTTEYPSKMHQVSTLLFDGHTEAGTIGGLHTERWHGHSRGFVSAALRH